MPAATPDAAPLPPAVPLKLQLFILAAPVLLFSMVAHEYAHGYAAKRQGDPTAYQLGRLTWNPIRHIDPFLTVILPMMTWFFGGFLFGGAKPVPVVPRNYRNFKRGDIIVSLAGIATNLLLAIVATVAIVLVGLLGRALPEITETCAILQVMLTFGMVFNVILAYFNLLPIPPLDGSHVMKYLLPARWSLHYQNLGRYGLLILLLLFTVGGRAFVVLLYPAYHLMGLALQVAFPFIIPSTTVPNPFLGLA